MVLSQDHLSRTSEILGHLLCYMFPSSVNLKKSKLTCVRTISILEIIYAKSEQIGRAIFIL